MKTIEAIDRAIQSTIDAGYLVEYLTKNKSEVRRMMLAEFNEIEREETLRKKSYAKGKKAGRRAGRIEERKNTKAERKRADKAEARVRELEAELAKYK
ncbi:MAG: hypothetical protein II497_04665 [Lachnospiraceae bacterium]|nr:hypothetical protein [Lachnospiraceae bacterium]